LYLAYLVFSYFNVSEPTELYTLSLHDALPIFTVENSVSQQVTPQGHHAGVILNRFLTETAGVLDHAHVWGYKHGAIVSDHTDLQDRKSTRLNSSHVKISYAVFCLKKKNLTDDL